MKDKERTKTGYGFGVFTLDDNGHPVDRRKKDRRKKDRRVCDIGRNT